MRVKIAGTLTAAQQAAVPRAAAYRGKQPYIEFFADCVIWYKNGWAAIIPMSHAIPYHWEGPYNTTITDLEFTPSVDSSKSTHSVIGGVTTDHEEQYPYGYDSVAGSLNSTRTATTHTIAYGSWFALYGVSYNDGGPPDPFSYGIVPPMIPGAYWQRLNGVCELTYPGLVVISNTLAWTVVYPSYELLSDSAAWNAVLLAQHVAAVDVFKNATPPAVSTSPATSVTVTVGATSALAHASISAAPIGLSSATYDNFGNANLVVITVPMPLVLVPDISGAGDAVVNVDFYRNGEFIASEAADPFTHEIVISSPETASYSAIYTDASDEVDTAPLAVTGLLSRVDFYRGAALLASSTAPPYSCTDPNLAEGSYTYSAIVYDDAGADSAGIVTVAAVGPAITGDALSAFTMTIPIAGRSADAEHAYPRPYFDGTFWKRGGIAHLFPLNPLAGGEPRGMYYDIRLGGDLTHLQVDGYARIQCGDPADLTAPFTVVDWTALPASTLPIDGVFPMYIVRVSDAANYGVYPIFGWWYDEVEQEQKVAMAAVPPPNFAIALLDFVRDTLS